MEDEVYLIKDKSTSPVLYKISQLYDGDADYYVKIRRASFDPQDFIQERLICDEYLRAVPLRRIVILEKWK